MCTRVIYTPKEEQSYVGRNMDWDVVPLPALWVLPSNVKRNSCVEIRGKKSFSWVSKFSSVIVSNFDGATSDGLNSAGLTANILWLAKSIFPSPQSETEKDLYPMSLSIWAQYILDTSATVAEAISAMDNIYILTVEVPEEKGNRRAKCHLSVGDKEGNSAIFEYLDGKLFIYTNVEVTNSNHTIKLYSKDKMRVMTNDPQFDKQIESLVYWNELNKKYESNNTPALLPGSNLPLDRFIRASYFTNQLPNQVNDRLMALANLSIVLSNAAQPVVKQENPESPDFSRTQYSSFVDQYRLQYFYRSGYSPFALWINLTDVIFEDLADGEAFKLPLDEKGVFFHDGDNTKEYASGNVNRYLQKSTMFLFIPVCDK